MDRPESRPAPGAMPARPAWVPARPAAEKARVRRKRTDLRFMMTSFGGGQSAPEAEIRNDIAGPKRTAKRRAHESRVVREIAHILRAPARHALAEIGRAEVFGPFPDEGQQIMHPVEVGPP